MLKRVAILLLAVLVCASISAQTVAHAMVMVGAAEAPSEATDIAPVTPASMPDMPCKGMIPSCADSLGCAVVVDLPVAPRGDSVAIRWVHVVWWTAQSSLDGLTVEP